MCLLKSKVDSAKKKNNKKGRPVRVSEHCLINGNQLMMAGHIFLLALQGNPCGQTKT